MDYITAGESHGPGLTAIVSGVPAGLALDEQEINRHLRRRQAGFGRGGRQTIEADTARITSGVRFGTTLGTPVAVQVENRDWRNWTDRMAVFGQAPDTLQREVTPRPGHADLVGVLRHATNDCRNILERSSARETAARVAASAIPRALLSSLGVQVTSYVVRIGPETFDDAALLAAGSLDVDAIEASDVRCPDAAASNRMRQAIRQARSDGESLGGAVRVVATGLVPGLGSFASGPDRLTSKLGGALFSIPAIKGVEFGLGFAASQLPGSQVHDPIVHNPHTGFGRQGNNAGGLEGGMTTGLPLVATVAMKPIPTLLNPLDTVDIDTLQAASASRERSDVCAVPAMGVVAEAEVCFVLASAYTSMFGGATMDDLHAAVDAYRTRVARQSGVADA